MRVLIFIGSFTTGGAERQAYLLAKNLRHLGHYVEFWAFESKSLNQPFYEKLIGMNIQCRQLPVFDIWSWAGIRREMGYIYNIRIFASFFVKLWHYRRSVPKESFDWAIPFTPVPSLVLLLYRGHVKIRSLIWSHRGGADSGNFPYTKLLTWFGRWRLNGLVANSQTGATHMAKVFCVPRDRVSFIGNIFELSDFYIRDNAVVHDKDMTKIIHLANFYPEKDPETVIRAFAKVAGHPRKPKLILVGRHLSASQLKGHILLVQQLGLEHAVDFIGEMAEQDVLVLLRSSNIGVLSTRSEGCPNAILEYMSVNLPIVATNIPSITDILPSESHQLLFDVGDEEGCANQLTRLLDDPSLGRDLAMKNFTHLRMKYEGDVVVHEWVQLLNSCSDRSLTTN